MYNKIKYLTLLTLLVIVSACGSGNSDPSFNADFNNVPPTEPNANFQGYWTLRMGNVTENCYGGDNTGVFETWTLELDLNDLDKFDTECATTMTEEDEFLGTATITCKIGGNSLAAHIDTDQTEGSCKVSTTTNISLNLTDVDSMTGTYNMSADYSGDCFSNLSSCNFKADLTGSKGQAPTAVVDFLQKPSSLTDQLLEQLQ